MTKCLPDDQIAGLKSYIETSLLNGKSVAVDENLLLSGLLDSLGVMSLVAYIEDNFAIAVPFEDVIIENFMTIDAMSQYIQSRKQADA